MMTIQNAKNRNTPQRMEHIMLRKAWPMTKEKRKLTKVVMEVLAERVSRGWISDGTNHPRGPL